MKQLFWIDLEMTGLDDNVDSILEVAVVITDINLQTVETYHRIVYQAQDVLDRMNDWCKTTHGASGLTAAVASGTPLATVENELIELVNRHFKGNERIVLVGNSVNNDKRFIDKHMPEFAKKLHYRLIDVSSFKEIFREKYGIVAKKADGHRALEDVFESIKELQLYLSYVKVENV